MQSYQQRVVDEYNDLQLKIDKLHDFIISPDFDEKVGDPEECSRLVYQRHTMIQYALALKERIDHF